MIFKKNHFSKWYDAKKIGGNNQSQNVSIFGGCSKLGDVSKSVKFVNFDKVSNFENLPNVLTLSLWLK